MAVVDLIFRLVGQELPLDHRYALYGAVCRILPSLHGSTRVGLCPITGTFVGNGKLLLGDHSCLRLRVDAERVAELGIIKLAGQRLEIDGCSIVVGTPSMTTLVPASRLHADLVVIKIEEVSNGAKITPDLFLTSTRKQLATLQVHGEAAIPLILTGPHAGEPRRKVLRIKDRTVVGYSLIVEGLAADESIKLQEDGIGGRRLMGCGLFLPLHDGR